MRRWTASNPDGSFTGEELRVARDVAEQATERDDFVPTTESEDSFGGKCDGSCSAGTRADIYDYPRAGDVLLYRWWCGTDEALAGCQSSRSSQREKYKICEFITKLEA